MRFWLIVVIVIFIGCAPDSYETDGYFSSVESVPPSGGEIAVNEAITVTFVNSPGCISVSHGFIRQLGDTVRIVGPFPQGPLLLTITWGRYEFDGIQRIAYTVVDKTDKQ